MEYTIIVDGRSYDLPKKAVAVMDKLDEALKVDSRPNLSARQKYEKLHSFVKEILGEENAKELFGSDNLAEIDLSELSLAVLRINDAYNQPLADYRADKMRESINSIPTEKIVSLTKSMQSVANAQSLTK